MLRKKTLAVLAMLAALIAIFVGISYANSYTSQTSTLDVVFTESTVVLPDGYGHIFLQLNCSEENYWLSLKVDNGTLRESVVSEELYAAWVNGTYKLSWFEVPDPVHPEGYDDYFLMGSYLPQAMHYVFWNPDSAVSKQATLSVATQHTETTYNAFNLGAGIFLIAFGAVSGLAAAYTLGKRVLFAVVALILIVAGAFLAATNSQVVYHEGIVASKAFTVPAASQVTAPIRYNATGEYAIQLTVDNGLNATVVSDENFAAFSEGTYEPHWYFGVSSRFGLCGRPVGEDSANKVFLVLSNPNATDKQVTVEVLRGWNEYNSLGLVGGVTLAALGAITLYLTFKPQIAKFNKALQNQE